MRWGDALLRACDRGRGLYARAVLSAEPYTPAKLDELLAARLERQQVLERAYLVSILDAGVLARCIGSAAIMAEQCAHLITLAESSTIAVHVIPEGTNTGSWAALDIATRGSIATVCLTTALQDVTTSAPDQVDQAMQVYERILGAALPRADSLERVRQQEESWKQRI